MIKAYQNYQEKLINLLFQFSKDSFFINSVVVCFHLPWFQYASALIGMNEKLTKTYEYVIEEFVCCLYGVKGIKSVNDARYQMFCGKKKMPKPQKLPPT